MPSPPLEAVLFTEIDAGLTDDERFLVVRFRDEAGNSVGVSLDSVQRIGQLRRALEQLESNIHEPHPSGWNSHALQDEAGVLERSTPEVRGAVGFSCRSTAGGGKLLDLQTADEEVLCFVFVREAALSMAAALWAECAERPATRNLRHLNS